MVEIIFEAHGTTFDNENHLSSGWNDVDLSLLGEQQSQEMGVRYMSEHFDAIFTSDLKRAWRSAEIAFCKSKVGKLITDEDFLKNECKFPIIKDNRLRECDYGDFTQHLSEEVDLEKPKRINRPFPNGESYEQTTLRMKDFLNDLIKKYDGKRVMIIGHRATQYGLDNLINYVPLKQLVSSKFKWQPGWKYELYEQGRSRAVAEGQDYK